MASQNAVHIAVHIRIGDTNNAPTGRFDKFGAALVMRKLLRRPMRRAIDHNQFGGDASEVGYVGANRMLATKARASVGATPDVTPQQSFGARHFAAQFLGEGAGAFFAFSHLPPPARYARDLPRKRGRS